MTSGWTAPWPWYAMKLTSRLPPAGMAASQSLLATAHSEPEPDTVPATQSAVWYLVMVSITYHNPTEVVERRAEH